MAPKPNNLKLSKEAFSKSGGEGGNARAQPPASVRLVIGGTAGIPAINELTLQFKKEGFGKQKDKTKLGGVAYEINPGEKADESLDAFRVAFETPGNVPVTLIHPLTGAVDPSKIPPPDTPPQFAQVCYTLPTIYKASDVQGANEQKWLEVLKIASERKLTLELAVAPQDDVRQAFEQLLGKAWDQEQSAKKESGQEDAQGASAEQHNATVRIVIDAFASPPLGQKSTQLMRSQEMESWSDFISRLALDPRVYLKLAPLPQPSAVVPTAIATHRRPVDALGSVAPLPGAQAVGSTVQAAVDSAAHTVNAVESSTTTSAAERREELQQRLRLFLETTLEAFGEERLVWTSTLSAGSGKDENQLSEPEQWFDAVLTTLQDIGVGQAAVDNVFSNTISKVYRM